MDPSLAPVARSLAMEWSALGLGPGETAVVGRLAPAISERKRLFLPSQRCSQFWAVRFWRRRSHCHICHGRYVTFQMAEVVVSQQMLADIVTLITWLRVTPVPA